MMLGNPIAFVAQRLGVLREVGGVGERLGDGAGIGDRHEVEKGQFRHAGRYAVAALRVQPQPSAGRQKKIYARSSFGDSIST